MRIGKKNFKFRLKIKGDCLQNGRSLTRNEGFQALRRRENRSVLVYIAVFRIKRDMESTLLNLPL